MKIVKCFSIEKPCSLLVMNYYDGYADLKSRKEGNSIIFYIENKISDEEYEKYCKACSKQCYDREEG